VERKQYVDKCRHINPKKIIVEAHVNIREEEVEWEAQI
jgi:hypothetical protein